ncbi:response regulator receiver domain protein [Heliomicrobium modesticaldum Ice1]|uniref:Stage 0 sporulation protein A homolog n=1 Tax=Heliobacterium modesticaldum (strain ATCC 51547 / Ice1) TaxID=498761 RepID=B0TBE3_HELMI|nr:response regulator [Heliomicrobium modesticaldum]ABZ85156.1 response regulator receiver domain protein [Heliomicrobium modesticaldum Ice1]
MARILICDDSNLSRGNLKKILTTKGHEIVGEAVNGEEACKKYSELKPELVTMDITMPKMDGIAALKKIIQENPRAKVIMISALGQAPKILEAINSGAKSYVTKPFDANKVLSAVDEVLKA